MLSIAHGNHTLYQRGPFFDLSGLAPAASLKIRTVRGIRATNARHRAKGAARLEIAFTVTQRHQTQEDAELHFLDHAGEVSGLATATFTLGEPGDSETRTLADAILAAQAIARDGLATTHRYTLTCGQIAD